MTNEIWDNLVSAAGDKYILCLYDKINMLENSTVFDLVTKGKYEEAVAYWMM
jgi:hypothetical protein